MATYEVDFLNGFNCMYLCAHVPSANYVRTYVGDDAVEVTVPQRDAAKLEAYLNGRGYDYRRKNATM